MTDAKDDDLEERVARAIGSRVKVGSREEQRGPRSFVSIGPVVVGIEYAARAAIAECFKWRDIKDAPRDGRKIIVIGGRYNEPTIVESDAEWWNYHSPRLKAVPTHFMPLPKGPEEER